MEKVVEEKLQASDLSSMESSNEHLECSVFVLGISGIRVQDDPHRKIIFLVFRMPEVVWKKRTPDRTE